ncbi:MAG: amidohydrolase family protein, partial [Geminicoccaceae bacterium]
MCRSRLHRRIIATALASFLASTPLLAATDSEELGAITVYVAKKIITMEPAQPEATAVAVADGRIVSVGTIDTLTPWTKDREVTIDRTFEDKVLMPGFIDPHLHPSLPAVLTQFAFIAPDDWTLPTGDFPGARTHEDYVARLKELVDGYFADPELDPAIPFIAWGYHQLWHGEIFREQLDELFPDRPVMLWHRSFHELIVNSAALELIGLTEAEVGDHHEIDWAKGHFWELG